MDLDLVIARLELRDLIDGYARAADRRDRAAFEALFAPDATLTVTRPGTEPHTYRGAAQIGEIVPRLGHYVATFHLVANHWCSVDGHVASGESYCQAHHVRAGSGDQPAVDLELTIRYLDTYARADPDRTDAGRSDHGAWRFTSREVHILWTRLADLDVGPDRPGGPDGQSPRPPGGA
jgi:hypothetical protein